jgi:tetratricopeptide (TPR) repeat protein
VREAAQAARAAPPSPDPPRAVDVVLDALALRLTEGHAAAAAALTRALELLVTLDPGAGEARRWLWLVGGRTSRIIAMELWDFESGYALAARQVQVAREAGALVHLQIALNFLGLLHLLTGELSVAERLIEEDHLIAEVTGNPPVGYAAMMLAAWQGREQEASELIQATIQEATPRGTGILAGSAAYASAVLHNGLGRYEAARDAARQVFERDDVIFGYLVVAELAEAAARTEAAQAFRRRWTGRPSAPRPRPRGCWASRPASALSVATARRRRLTGVGRAAGPTRVRAELARSHLLYGRAARERRRAEARAAACRPPDAEEMGRRRSPSGPP